jgi:hypothetical protein
MLMWVSVASGIMLVLTAIGIPFAIVKLPEDYLVNDGQAGWLDKQPAMVRWGLSTLKNLLGVVLVILGIIMLVLPGQGILSIVLGLSLVDFPGRHALQCKLIRRPKVIDSINWIRLKFHRPPLILPDSC